MPVQTHLDPALAAELKAVATDSGCVLLEAELRGNTLRLTLDREQGGVTLADCETVSKQVSALLDVVDYGSSRYVLEVTSPGLDRKLYGEADYRRFEGRQVRVTWRGGEDDQKQTIVGELVRLDGNGDGHQVVVSESEGAAPKVIPLASIELARLVPEL